MNWPHFTEEELKCKCGCGRCEMDEKFMFYLEALRVGCGFPFPVTSGFRCSECDKDEGSSTTPGSGPHTTGKAVDFHVANVMEMDMIIERSYLYGFCGRGIGETYVHLDMCHERTRPALWSY